MRSHDGGLERELARPFEGPTVAVTHHGVPRHSVQTCYREFAAAAGFVSHLPDLLPMADLWVHGQTTARPRRALPTNGEKVRSGFRVAHLSSMPAAMFVGASSTRRSDATLPCNSRRPDPT